MSHLLAYATWQPIPYIAGDLGIPEQTIRSWMGRGYLAVMCFEGRLLVERRVVDNLNKDRLKRLRHRPPHQRGALHE